MKGGNYEMIDSHAHIGQFKEWHCPIEELYKQMQKAGVRKAIISNIAGNEFDYEHNVLNDQTILEVNEQTLEEMKKYPECFKMLVWIRPFSKTGFERIEDFIHAHRGHIVGLKVHPYCAGVKLNDEKYVPYIALCERYDFPFWVHTEEDGYSNIAYMKALAKQYPKVKFVAVHMGLRTNHREAIQAIKKYDNLYGDTTLVRIEDVLYAIKECGQDKILFGSDAITMGEDSYGMYREMYRRIQEEFGQETVEGIFRSNVSKLMTWDI
ncbi:MAG: amidohydrolase family protein [Cellulosilyticum sp.]|nr:amidohydrolase family protein [Cellulosilyticum sp.]